MHASSHNWGVCVYIIHKQVSCTYITDMKFVLNWYKHICQWLTWPQEPGLTLKNPPTRRISKKIRILTPYHNYWSVFLTAEKKELTLIDKKLPGDKYQFLVMITICIKKQGCLPGNVRKEASLFTAEAWKWGDSLQWVIATAWDMTDCTRDWGGKALDDSMMEIVLLKSVPFLSA